MEHPTHALLAPFLDQRHFRAAGTLGPQFPSHIFLISGVSRGLSGCWCTFKTLPMSLRAAGPGGLGWGGLLLAGHSCVGSWLRARKICTRSPGGVERTFNQPGQ